MTYVDGMLAAVPTNKKDDFLKHAKTMAGVFKEYGALSIVDCWGDDVPEGKINSFHTAVMRKPDETVIFSWITWPSKEVRDAGMQKVMNDPRMHADVNPIPFDGKRMIFGGFETLMEA